MLKSYKLPDKYVTYFIFMLIIIHELLNFKFRTSFMKHFEQKAQSMTLILLHAQKESFLIIPFLETVGHRD